MLVILGRAAAAIVCNLKLGGSRDMREPFGYARLALSAETMPVKRSPIERIVRASSTSFIEQSESNINNIEPWMCSKG